MIATPAQAQAPRMDVKQEKRTPETAMAHAKIQIKAYEWYGKQWVCLKALWTAESNWRPDARNKTPVKTKLGYRHAGGVPQILGLDPKTPVALQISRGLVYVEARYGSPCSAWDFHRQNGWY